MKKHCVFIFRMLTIITLIAAMPALEMGKDSESAIVQSVFAQAPVPSPTSKETLRVSEGKSFVLDSADTIKRVAVTSSEIAEAIVISPNQVLIHGVKAGTVSFLLWNELEQVRAFDLQVVPIPMNLEPVRAILKKTLPDQNIQITQSGASIILTGNVSTVAIAEQAATIAKTASDKIVNLLSTPSISQVIMLEVKFAEVSRNALQQLGLNILSTGALNTIGSVSTQQYSSLGEDLKLASSIGAPLRGFTTEVELKDLLNIFVFRPDLNLGLFIKALQQKNLAQTLAEPNLIALGGKEASFLAGGEYPVPIVQGTSGNSSVSIQFKEFGVRLRFVATPNPDETINLHVAPEVSSLDYANSVTLAGFTIPALVSRKAETEVLLKNGQSFAIAGLLDNRVTKISSKVPWLGDVPILGNLFKSTNFAKAKTELLVTVTPRIVKPLEPGQELPLPEFPVPVLDKEKFDSKSGK